MAKTLKSGKTTKETEGEEAKKRPVEERDGKLVKTDEKEAEQLKAAPYEGEETPEEEGAEAAQKAEGEEVEAGCAKAETEEEEEDLTPLTPEEKSVYMALKGKLRNFRKGDGSPLSPQESEARSASSEGTTSPGAGVPSKPQDKFNPPTSVEDKRTQETPMGAVHKNADNALEASPLYKTLSKQLGDDARTLNGKMDALQKSVNDRLANLQKHLDNFYGQSFYKAAGESLGPEGLKKESITEQIANGRIRKSQ